MKINGLILALIFVLSGSAVQAGQPSTVGLKGIKAAFNDMHFVSAKLKRTSATLESQRLEQLAVQNSSMDMGEMTDADYLIETVEVGQSSVHFKLVF